MKNKTDLPPVPEGFTQPILGPLKVQAATADERIDVCLLNSSGKWVEIWGGDSERWYCLRKGSSIHLKNAAMFAPDFYALLEKFVEANKNKMVAGITSAAALKAMGEGKTVTDFDGNKVDSIKPKERYLVAEDLIGQVYTLNRTEEDWTIVSTHLHHTEVAFFNLIR